MVSMIQNRIDMMQSSGRGLIILLHGVPGVGKTSTAGKQSKRKGWVQTLILEQECVAANTGRPLFPITCGTYLKVFALQPMLI
jgi:signal recognition particle GTPase